MFLSGQILNVCHKPLLFARQEEGTVDWLAKEGKSALKQTARMGLVHLLQGTERVGTRALLGVGSRGGCGGSDQVW